MAMPNEFIRPNTNAEQTHTYIYCISFTLVGTYTVCLFHSFSSSSLSLLPSLWFSFSFLRLNSISCTAYLFGSFTKVFHFHGIFLFLSIAQPLPSGSHPVWMRTRNNSIHFIGIAFAKDDLKMVKGKTHKIELHEQKNIYNNKMK